MQRFNIGFENRSFYSRSIGLVAIIIAGMLTNKVTSEHISMVIGAFMGAMTGYGSGKYAER